MKTPRFKLNPAIIGLFIAAFVAAGVSYFSGFSFWIILAIIIGAMMVNGIIAEREDNAPGGFNNPLPSPDQSRPAKPLDEFDPKA